MSTNRAYVAASCRNEALRAEVRRLRTALAIALHYPNDPVRLVEIADLVCPEPSRRKLAEQRRRAVEQRKGEGTSNIYRRGAFYRRVVAHILNCAFHL
jgi:hypothetical protein